MNIDKLPNEIDQRPPKDAWASGWYINTCQICSEMFMGAKRARTCAPCAYNDKENNQ